MFIAYIEYNLQFIPTGYPDIARELADNHLALLRVCVLEFFGPAAKLLVVQIHGTINTSRHIGRMGSRVLT